MNLRRKAQTLAMLSISLVMIGCATQPKSTAYKIDSTLGTMDIRDKETVEEHQEESVLGRHGIAIAGSAYNDYTYGASGLSDMRFETLGISLLIAGLDALGPPRASERTFIVGRLPMTQTQTARDIHAQLYSVYEEAFTETMKEAGVTFEVFQGSKDTERVARSEELDLDELYQFNIFIIHAPEAGCEFIEAEGEPKDSNCAALIRAGRLEKQIAPYGHTLAGQEVWAIDSGNYHYIKFTYAKGTEAMLPAADLQKRMSEKLPDWAYMFMPDATNYVVVNAKGEAKGYPYYLNQGEELQFVTPKKTTQ